MAPGLSCTALHSLHPQALACDPSGGGGPGRGPSLQLRAASTEAGPGWHCPVSITLCHRLGLASLIVRGGLGPESWPPSHCHPCPSYSICVPLPAYRTPTHVMRPTPGAPSAEMPSLSPLQPPVLLSSLRRRGASLLPHPRIYFHSMEMISLQPASPLRAAPDCESLGSETIFGVSLPPWHLVPCLELGRCSGALLNEGVRAR